MNQNDKIQVTLTPASVQDIPDMLALMEEHVKAQLMLPRTADDLREKIGNFIVARTPEGKIAGTAALRPFGDGYFEVRSLAVDCNCVNAGIGSKLVAALLDKARKLNPPAVSVFALTKRPNLFLRLGFKLAFRERFPAKIWTDCLQCPKYDDCDETAVEYKLKLIHKSL